MLGVEHHARLTALIEEGLWLVVPVLNMTGKRLKSRGRPDERVASDERVQ